MAEKAAISILLNEFEKEQKNPPQKTMKKRQGGGLSSARAMVWLSVSRECELFILTVYIVYRKRKKYSQLYKFKDQESPQEKAVS